MREKPSRSRAGVQGGGGWAGRNPHTWHRLQQTAPSLCGTEPDRAGATHCAQAPRSVPVLLQINLTFVFPHKMHTNTQEQLPVAVPTLCPAPGWALRAHTDFRLTKCLRGTLAWSLLSEVGTAGTRVIPT